MTKNGLGKSHYREPRVGANRCVQTYDPLPSELEAPKSRRFPCMLRQCIEVVGLRKEKGVDEDGICNEFPRESGTVGAR